MSTHMSLYEGDFDWVWERVQLTVIKIERRSLNNGITYSNDWEREGGGDFFVRKRQQFFLNIPFSLLLFSTIELLLLVSVKGGGGHAMSMRLLINTYLTCSGNTVNIHQISKEFTRLVRLLCLLQKLASSY